MARLLLALLILALFASSIPFAQTVSAVDYAQWTPLNLPTEGVTGKWVLANGSDIRQLTMASDGTLYCYANPSGTTNTLFKSSDSGRSWTTAGGIIDVITDIVVLQQDVNTIYFATSSKVFRSSDAGKTFTSLTDPGGAGSGNVSITSIDVVRNGSTNMVAVSTKDNDAGQFGGVFLLDESKIGGDWVNTNIGNYDVCRVVFSPNYASDRQLIAVATDETDTLLTSSINTSSWGQMIGTAYIAGIVPITASIAFTEKYNALENNSCYYIGIDAGANAGDVYKVKQAFTPNASLVVDLNAGSPDNMAGVDITSLAINGNTVLAGCARSAQVYITNNSGDTWNTAAKQPTGQNTTCVLISPEFTTQHKAFAVTCGTESAFSCSADGGVSWNQISLIDSKISEIHDVATPSLTSLFILTNNADNLKHSLWRTSDGGKNWDRIFCSIYTGLEKLRLVKTIPQYSITSPSILVAGQKDGLQVMWKSDNNGDTFSQRPTPCTVDTWVVIDNNSWFISGYDGSKGLVYRTANAGNFYSAPVEIGFQRSYSLVLSPDYVHDKTIIAGNTIGQVYLSEDNGDSFRLIGQQLPLTTGIGRVNVAFDTKFSENKIIFASTDAKVTSTSKERIFRFTVGQSANWQSVNGSLPENTTIKQLTVASDGTLYALNTQAVLAVDKKGGVVRSLNPAQPSPTFETMLRGLDDTTILKMFSASGNTLYTTDNNTRLITFADSLTLPVTLTFPENKALGVDTASLVLKWQTLNGATEYEWQVADKPEFTNILPTLTGTSESASARVTSLTPATNYYWRVRATKPFLSQWSEGLTFTTVPGGTNVVPLLAFPEPGAKTGPKPVFQWGTITYASKYELLVAKDTAFSDIVIEKCGDKALSSNAWESDVSLDSATYYWKVRACSNDSLGAWSAVSVFSIDPAPVQSTLSERTLPVQSEIRPSQTTVVVTQTQTQTPAAPTTQTVNVTLNIPTWIMYSGIGLLVAVVITLITMLMVTLKRRH